MSKRLRKSSSNNEHDTETHSDASFGTQHLQEKASQNTRSKFSQMLSSRSK